jgi:hypothetical protein
LRVVAEVEINAELHPVHLAERIAVADRCLAGRLTIVLRQPSVDVGSTELAETLTILELALASRPFEHRGERWTIPARLDANDDVTWSMLTVTPSPSQFEVPIWLSGLETAELAARDGYVWLRDLSGIQGSLRDRVIGSLSGRLRPAFCSWSMSVDGGVDALATAADLASGREGWGLDLAFLPLIEAGADQLDILVSRVRPRVQLAELPPGLSEFWEDTLPGDSLEQ